MTIEKKEEKYKLNQAHEIQQWIKHESHSQQH